MIRGRERNLTPSGCEEFDRGRQLLTEFRDEEALDYFELASGRATDAAVRASAAAFVAGLLLGSNRPWEVEAWAVRSCGRTQPGPTSVTSSTRPPACSSTM